MEITPLYAASLFPACCQSRLLFKHVYGLDRQEPGDIKNLVRHVVCYDAETEAKLWQNDIPATEGEDPYTGIGVTAKGYASHTPVSDGERIFAFLGKSGVYAYDLDGIQVWRTSVGSESDPWKWGSSASPIVFEETVIVPATAESQAIVALDKETGKDPGEEVVLMACAAVERVAEEALVDAVVLEVVGKELSRIRAPTDRNDQLRTSDEAECFLVRCLALS